MVNDCFHPSVLLPSHPLRLSEARLIYLTPFRNFLQQSQYMSVTGVANAIGARAHERGNWNWQP